MMIGQFCLAAKADPVFLSLGLFLLIIGNGFFKPNIAVIVGDLYKPDDPRKDSAYTIFYMGVNVGALIAPFDYGLFGYYLRVSLGGLLLPDSE